MYAVEEGKVPGVKKSVGEDFINASHGLKHLPEHVRKHEATSKGRPFASKKGDGRPQTGGPRRKARPDSGQNGMGAGQNHNAGGFGGQTQPTPQYRSSYP
jgi:hypothetical protein